MSKHADELTRKEMKAPDAFQTAAAKAAAWLTGKQKANVAAVVGALVVVRRHCALSGGVIDTGPVEVNG